MRNQILKGENNMKMLFLWSWEVLGSTKFNCCIVTELIEYLINYRNVDTFISGGMGEFDRLCESAIGD